MLWKGELFFKRCALHCLRAVDADMIDLSSPSSFLVASDSGLSDTLLVLTS